MTGCRPNEFPNKQCFDFQNNLIHIYGTKTETSKHRTIEMSENFSQYIKKYLLQNELKTPAYIKNKFKEICENIKIKDPVIYRLRHTFATNHFTLGTQSKYVQEWLGHSSVKLTLDIYTDIDKTSSKEKIKELYKDFYYEIIK
jgi:integrase